MAAVPSPAAGGRSARRDPLGATHLSYLTTSANPFNPQVAGVIPAQDEVGGYAVYVYACWQVPTVYAC
jgi:hypothetical protein